MDGPATWEYSVMNNLPSDPEEAADALIAAFAGSSSRDKIVLPTRPPDELSESDLEGQQCVVLQGGTPTYAGLHLDDAPQAFIERFLAASGMQAVTNLDAFEVTRLRFVEAPFLGGQLALLPHREGKIEVPFFVDGSSVTLASRTNEWIYESMEQRPSPQPDTNLVAYIRFFFATVVGQLGAFRFADNLDDAIWLSEATEAAKAKFFEEIVPLHIVGGAGDGGTELRGTVIFKNALFVTSVIVAKDWTIELTNEDALIEDLPIVFGPKFDLLLRR
jgi:hypothetical protein